MSQNRSVHCNVTLYVTLLQLSVYSEKLFVFFLKRLYDDDDDDDEDADDDDDDHHHLVSSHNHFPMSSVCKSHVIRHSQVPLGTRF